MNDKELIRSALEALESCSGAPHWETLQPVVTALREAMASEAIEQPVQHEPVFWTRKQWGMDREFCEKPFTTDWEPLYTSPPAQRKPLTLGQKQRLWSSVGDKPTLKDRVNAYGLAIEAAHGIKEKNT